jgi:hypothetical protein
MTFISRGEKVPMMVVIQTHEAREEDPPWGYFLTCYPEVLDIELSPT